MKTRILIIIVAGLIFMSAGSAQAYTIDGNLSDWGAINPGTNSWTPNSGIYYTAEDYVGPDGFVNPGYGGQQCDAEGLYLTWDDTNLYLALVTGFPNTGSGIGTGDDAISAGDIAIDFGIDGNYDYALELDNHAANYLWGYNGIYGKVYKASEWTASYYPETSPLYMAGGSSPVAMGDANLAYNSIYYGTDHWVMEASINRGLFGSDWNNYMRIHWTQSCGNDGIDVATPEPMSGLLLGLGAIGTLLRFRKKK